MAAFAGAATAGLLLALACSGRWRRVIVAAGFPLAATLQGAAAGWPAWGWLLLLLPLLLAYPLRAWRDAPLFPTPAGALAGLPAVVGSPGRVLDAGCGLGHGLRALRGAWPGARVHGIEWSPLLALATRLRCRFAEVRQGDMWRPSWAGFDLVYLFQRPESMARAWAKATAEMAPGSWLVSLEFAVPGVQPWARIDAGPERPLWIYRVGQGAAPGPASTQPGRGR
jgi:SAM-dependent methyltransferase